MASVAAEISEDPDAPNTLLPHEQDWADRVEFLRSEGYNLRLRYQPGWVPSWRGKPPGSWTDAEDGLTLPLRPGVIDAIRISDNSLVYIKKIRTHSDELKIARYLSSDELRQDPRNHCVPVLDVLHPPAAEDTSEDFSFIVMPFLRFIDSPGFETVGDVLQCGEKLLEGLVFLHEHRVAHRDCAYKNIMMDASPLYPQGHHPIQHDFLPDLSHAAPVLPRAGAEVKYYFTDFGISTRFEPAAGAEDRIVVTGRQGLDQSAPELSDDVPYDPFKLDVYLLGNVFKSQFVEKFRNLNKLGPLVTKMTDRDPAKRPTASDALQEWQTLQSGASVIQRSWRVQSRREVFLSRIIRDTFYSLYLIYVLLRPRHAATTRLPSPAH